MLERETQFIEITEAVHARIIDAHMAELRSAERLHQVFTELAVSGADNGSFVGKRSPRESGTGRNAKAGSQPLVFEPSTKIEAELWSQRPVILGVCRHLEVRSIERQRVRKVNAFQHLICRVDNIDGTIRELPLVT